MYVSKVGNQEFIYGDESLQYKNLNLRYRNMENISRVNDIQNPGFVFDYMGNHVRIPCNPDEAEAITDIFIEASKIRQKELDMMNAYQDLEEPEAMEFPEESPMIIGSYGNVSDNFSQNGNFNGGGNFSGNLTANGSIDLSQLQNDISQMQNDMSYLKQNSTTGNFNISLNGGDDYQLKSDFQKESNGSFMEEFYTLEELENIDNDAKKKDEIESQRQQEEGFEKLTKRDKKQKKNKNTKNKQNNKKEKKPKKEKGEKKGLPAGLKVLIIIVVVLVIAVLGLWFYSSWAWSTKGELTFLFKWLIQHGYNVIM